MFPNAPAICYSGFRDGQSPDTQTFPTYDEVKEDLRILQKDWNYLRLYDCDEHAERVFEVIEKENMDFEVMLGAYIAAEVNNPDCPWGGGLFRRAARQEQNAQRRSDARPCTDDPTLRRLHLFSFCRQRGYGRLDRSPGACGTGG